MDTTNKIAIEVKNLTKVYKVYKKPTDRLKEALNINKKSFHSDFYALKDISFSIRKGETVGIIGKNGSGKSTLLKIITGVLSKTSGKLEVNGKVAALLELGAGFNPEYTGLENIYLNGTIMGFTKQEIKEKIQDILAFADIGEFIYRPVKTYSSGMFSRLAFAVAIHVEPDILIVDEALSVGDHFFQAKCMSAINKLSSRGCTILLVSHSNATIKALCNRAILLNEGELELESNYCDEVIDRYFSIILAEKESDIQRKNTEQYSSESPDFKYQVGIENVYKSKYLPEFRNRFSERFGNNKALFIECCIFNKDNNEVTVVNVGEEYKVKAWLKFNENCDTYGEVGIVVRTLEGIDLFAINSFFNNVKLEPQKSGDVRCIEFNFPILLGPGKYSVTLGYRSPIQGEYVDKIFNAMIFEVTNSGRKVVPLLFDIPGEIKIY